MLRIMYLILWFISTFSFHHFHSTNYIPPYTYSVLIAWPRLCFVFFSFRPVYGYAFFWQLALYLFLENVCTFLSRDNCELHEVKRKRKFNTVHVVGKRNVLYNTQILMITIISCNGILADEITENKANRSKEIIDADK